MQEKGLDEVLEENRILRGENFKLKQSLEHMRQAAQFQRRRLSGSSTGEGTPVALVVAHSNLLASSTCMYTCTINQRDRFAKALRNVRVHRSERNYFVSGSCHEAEPDHVNINLPFPHPDA